MKKIIPSWLYWIGLLGSASAVGGGVWFYQQFRAFHERYDSLMNAGVSVEANLPLFPRFLALSGLLTMVISVFAILIKRMRDVQ